MRSFEDGTTLLLRLCFWLVCTNKHGKGNDGTRIPTTLEGVPIKRSVEGYVIIGTNIHEEATEEDLFDFFSEYGAVKSIHLNLDRQTGYVKGYVFVVFGQLDEAKRALEQGHGEDILGRKISLEYAIVDGGEDDQAPGYGDRRRERSPSRYGDLMG